jgi:hypothetical protein
MIPIMRLSLSIGAVKADYIFWFVIGIFLVALGIYVVLFRPMIGIGGSLTLGGNYGILGIIFVISGLAIIKRTYPIFIPIYYPESIRTCPHCGATVKGNTCVCKKCKQLP